MNRILVTGGTGLVGRRIAELNENVLVTSRNAASAKKNLGDNIVDVVEWPDTTQSVDLQSHLPIDAIVNLMGESIASGRWNEAKKKRIYDSRVVGTRRLVESVQALDTKPSVVVSASAVGYYGDAGDDEVDETHPVGTGFLPDTCRDWEQEARAFEAMGIRLCILRIGIVMSRDGGALAEMLPIFQKGLGGRLGSGRQFFPWIHINDLVRMIGWAINNESAHGIYNASAPNPVTNREYTRQLSAALSRPAILPVPKFAVRAALGEFADSLFDSQRVVPAAALRDGFEFQFPDIEKCFADLFA